MTTEQRGAELALRTKRFALSVIGIYTRLPKSTLHQLLGRQLLKSATSVGAQYREAMRAKSIPDFVSKIEGALQELSETQYWLELLEDTAPQQQELHSLASESHELTAIFVASVRKAKLRTRSVRVVR